jgi:hypothetical protein
MTKKYKYKVQEYSQDTRQYFMLKVILNLTDDEINECAFPTPKFR